MTAPLSPEFKTMRIADNNTPGTPANDQATRANGTQVSGPATKGTATPASGIPDGLQLSKFAGTLSQVVQSESASRSRRVAQLATAVKAGTYEVDSAAVSRAIVDHAVSAGQTPNLD
jgi:flagellar biosynthesis anti-sigma factor FlgM